jgi:hypothetical protein
MERLHQMHVVPDVLGSLRPSLDLHFVIRGNPTPIEPGVYLIPKQVRAGHSPTEVVLNLSLTDQATTSLVRNCVSYGHTALYSTYGGSWYASEHFCSFLRLMS